MKIKRANKTEFEPFTITVESIEEATVLFAGLGNLAPAVVSADVKDNDFYPDIVRTCARSVNTNQVTRTINAFTEGMTTILG